MALAGALALNVGCQSIVAAITVATAATMIIAALALVAADGRRRRIPGLLAQAVPPAIALAFLFA